MSNDNHKFSSNNMNQNFQVTQEALRKILTNLGGQPHEAQLPQEPVILEDPPVVAEIAVNPLPLVATQHITTWPKVKHGKPKSSLQKLVN